MTIEVWEKAEEGDVLEAKGKKEFQRGSDQNVVEGQTSSNAVEKSSKIRTGNFPFDLVTGNVGGLSNHISVKLSGQPVRNKVEDREGEKEVDQRSLGRRFQFWLWRGQKR